MIITNWDNFIATDNFVTNLPISQISSIPMADRGMGPDDLLLISRPCDPSAMTETGYMSYKAELGNLSAWMYRALDVSGITSDIRDLSLSVGYLWQFKEMLEGISNACPSAVVDIYDEYNRFNPFVISAIWTEAGVLTDLKGYRFSDAMSKVFDWKKFNSISAISGYFDSISAGAIKANTLTAATINATNVTATNGKFVNLTATNGWITNAHITGLTAVNASISNLAVDGHPFQHLSVMAQSAYNVAAKQPHYFYFTYPG